METSTRRQGRLLAFGLSGAMALALTSCQRMAGGSGPAMIAPPNDFTTNQAETLTDTNQAPSAAYVHGYAGTGGYLGGRGYYPIYGYPGYYYRPTPGTTVELIEGGSPGYEARSPAEANESIARGGFGASGEGEGEGDGHGGGE